MSHEYVLVLVDEFPQLSRPNFERIIRLWENTGKAFVLVLLGDFCQLPSIEGSNAKDSPYWKHVHKVKFHKCWRANDDMFLSKVMQLRKNVPGRRLRNNILRARCIRSIHNSTE